MNRANGATKTSQAPQTKPNNNQILYPPKKKHSVLIGTISGIVTYVILAVITYNQVFLSPCNGEDCVGNLSWFFLLPILVIPSAIIGLLIGTINAVARKNGKYNPSKMDRYRPYFAIMAFILLCAFAYFFIYIFFSPSSSR
ncbi:hypothetical protein IJM16_00100 [Candidatus Saccharibacteria bacterium]|nr:hypothetical protein [Candidatus Saccharibacteria bacterium]